MKKKKLKKEIAELRSEIQVLQETVGKLEEALLVTPFKCKELEPNQKAEFERVVKYYKKQYPINPELLRQQCQNI